MYDARGGVIADLSPTRWAVVDIDRLPEYVPQAFVAVEDQHFFEHNGVHWPRFIAQTGRNLIPGQRGAGASTITMQAARNVFPDRLPASERTVQRKLLEIRVAQEIERHYTKDEILQLYLNNIYFGEGVYGIASAARVYFGKNPSDLRLSEAAMLAGLPKAPTNYNPRRNLQRSVQRRNLVLSLMAAQGKVTAEDAAEAKDAPVRLARWNPEERRRSRAPYFTEQVRRHAGGGAGRRAVPGRAHASTRRWTRASSRPRRRSWRRRSAPSRTARSAGSRGRGGPRTAIPRRRRTCRAAPSSWTRRRATCWRWWAAARGATRASTASTRGCGSRDRPSSRSSTPRPSRRARAVTDTVRDDTVRRELPGGEVWVPRNFDGRYRGPVTVRYSLRQSINTVAIKLAERSGAGGRGGHGPPRRHPRGLSRRSPPSPSAPRPCGPWSWRRRTRPSPRWAIGCSPATSRGWRTATAR